MPTDDNVTRRYLLRASAATAAGMGSIGAASASPTDSVPADEELQNRAERVPRLTVEDRTETVPVSGLPEQATGIRPGSQMLINFADGTTAGCTANFIWRDAQGGDSGGSLYIGAAGHCFLPEGPADQRAQRQHEDGENLNKLIDSVKVCADCTFGGAMGLIVVEGAVIELGQVAYARWGNPAEDDDSPVGHDFGMVEIKHNQEDAIDPSMPQFGGPNAVSEGAVDPGQPINQYGAGVGNGEVFPTMGSHGVSFGDGGSDDRAWYGGIRASPGDSGSPIQSTTAGEGIEGDEAAGILTHITGSGIAGTTIGRCKEMVKEDINRVIEVVKAGDL